MRNKSRENLIYRAKNITLAGGNVKRTHPFSTDLSFWHLKKCMLYVYKITSMKVLTACLYSSGRISTLSTSFVSGVSACAKEKIAFAACAGHLIEIVRPSETEGSFVVSSGCSSDTGTSSEFMLFTQVSKALFWKFKESSEASTFISQDFHQYKVHPWK